MREQGYYWVKYKGKWIIAEWWPNMGWSIAGFIHSREDYDFEEIDEKRITR